ncbi:anaerobic ribonucleoside-triphosphate reductase activating protein, partial [Candidatus Woesearchaeota archaeon]
MKILGFIRTSLVDYPGNIVSTIFTGGCNFRCPFCHNPELVESKGQELSQSKILEFLEQRKHLTDGVCITGGEPTIHSDLPELVKKIKSLKLKVKLDTNGTNPDMLKNLLSSKLLDYIAMDIKSSLNNYSKATSTELDLEKIKESIEIIKSSNIDYEFRTTMVKKFVSKEDLIGICNLIKGSKRFYLQQFDPRNNLIDNSLKK